jgi:hypothetical protein
MLLVQLVSFGRLCSGIGVLFVVKERERPVVELAVESIR